MLYLAFPHPLPKSSGCGDIHSFLTGLPIRFSSPIAVSFLPHLTISGSRLLSAAAFRGKPVHAASFIKERRIVLETALLDKPQLLRLILVHEVGHFVWPRLGNRLRSEFEGIIAAECTMRARGEMGESAAVAKANIGPADVILRNKLWRDYVCESFCDTAALLYSGVSRWRFHTLAPRWRARREAWFRTAIHWDSRCF